MFNQLVTNLNRNIFETIYHAAVEASVELAIAEGPYSSFSDSPASKGILSFDMWDNPTFSGMYDWPELKNKVIKHGMRNSLLVAPMPTASTSQILGNNECFQPYISNIYIRRTNAGEFVIINKHLIKELIELNIWNENLKPKL